MKTAARRPPFLYLDDGRFAFATAHAEKCATLRNKNSKSPYAVDFGCLPWELPYNDRNTRRI